MGGGLGKKSILRRRGFWEEEEESDVELEEDIDEEDRVDEVMEEEDWVEGRQEGRMDQIRLLSISSIALSKMKKG